MNVNRRRFLKTTVMSAAALAAPGTLESIAQTGGAAPKKTAGGGGRTELIDTNVHLGHWPFRHLKYGTTPALVAKLKRHGITQAWAGTFDGLFSKDLSGANARLVEECRKHGDGFLLPFGSVNPAWPGWEEDLRRCHEVHRMRGIRLHPSYQNFTLDDPQFAKLLEQATTRGLLVQIALELEDSRVHHPIIRAPSVSPIPLAAVLQKLPAARVQLLDGSFAWQRTPQARLLLELPNLVYDISNLEGVGAVGRLIEGKHWNLAGKVPIERLLFGSHAPYFPVEATLLRMFESPFTREQMQTIMAANARRILGQI
ncbi:MAG: amidohydrolase family protein [Opitutaceae bacterium]|nr:amidohydrolase family protein [Opitutaceae bacterium]